MGKLWPFLPALARASQGQPVASCTLSQPPGSLASEGLLSQARGPPVLTSTPSTMAAASGVAGWACEGCW